MKKNLIAGACIVTAACLLVGCSGGTDTKVQAVQPKPPPTAKVESPESVVSKGLVANKEAPPEAPKKKADSTP